MSGSISVRVQLQFVSGIELPGTSTREREITDSRKRSHAAKYSWRQRGARQSALGHSSHGVTSFPKIIQSQRPLPSASRSEEVHNSSSEAREVPTRPRLASKHFDPLTRNSLIYLQPQNDLRAIFRTSFELRAIKLWDEQLSHLLARFESPFETVFTQIIPRLAFWSSVVKDMLLAVTFLHESLHHRHLPQWTDDRVKARLYYGKGLIAMRNVSSPCEIVAAARLACCYEALQDNWHACMLHNKGWNAVLKAHSNSANNDLQTLGQLSRTTATFYISANNRVPLDSAKSLMIPVDEMISEARSAIVCIARVLGRTATLTESAILEMKTSLNHWLNAVKGCDKDSGQDAYLDCLLPLVEFATVLLPERANSKNEDIRKIKDDAEHALRRATSLDYATELLASLVQLGVLIHEFTNEHKSWAFDFGGRVKVLLHNSLSLESR